MSLNVSTNRNAQSANAVAGPSTPRRFRDPAAAAANNNSQTTPARRQTLTPSRHIPSPTTLTINGSQQPLPELNFPPLPTRIVAMSSKVKETIESDMAAWDAALRLARERKSDKKRRHEQMKNDLLDEERRWQQECERLRREGADVVKALEREKAEIADATTKLTAIEDRKRALERQLEAIRADTEEWAIKLAEIQDKNRRDRAAFDEQANRDEPELEFIQNTLGLHIDGKPRDVICFTFTLIDPADHKRPFVFDLAVSETDYSVPLTKPALPPSVIRALLARLNDNKEFGGFALFVKGMRQAFVDLVQAEARDRQQAFAR